MVRVPGDKSISHRTALLAGISSGASEIRGFLQAEDCLNTLKAMESFGARSWFDDEGVLTIQGTGGKMIEPAGPLDVGNSGTGMRLLAGLCAGSPIRVTLTGDESLRSRPMRRIKEPLEAMGAKLELTPQGTAPMTIQGGNLKGIEYCLPTASAQVKSCCILAGLYATGRTTVTEPIPTRDHTERMLRGTEVGGAEIPNLIDELPLVAVLGTLAKGRTVIRDASELRVKESDRVAVMVENLANMGANVTEQADGMIIEGPTRAIPEKSIRSYGDHRVAMSMSILAIFAEQPVCIGNVACVDTSYPEFWDQLRNLGVKVE